MQHPKPSLKKPRLAMRSRVPHLRSTQGLRKSRALVLTASHHKVNGVALWQDPEAGQHQCGHVKEAEGHRLLREDGDKRTFTTSPRTSVTHQTTRTMVATEGIKNTRLHPAGLPEDGNDQRIMQSDQQPDDR
jgi:hypothetical protein